MNDPAHRHRSAVANVQEPSTSTSAAVGHADAWTQPGESTNGIPIPGQRLALAVIAAGLMLSMTTWFSTSAVLPELRERWELSTNASSLLVIVLQIGFVAGAVGSAAFGLADRIDLRVLIPVSAVGAAVANLAIVPIDRYGVAVVLRLLTGAFLAGVYPPALKLVSTWFRVGRGAAMGVIVAALTVGSAAPHLLNAIGGASWTVVISWSSLLTVAGGTVVALFGRSGPFPFPVTSFDLRQARRAMRQREVMLASLGYLGHMWELYAMWGWIALFLADVVEQNRSGLDPSAVAFVVIGSGAIGSIVAGRAGERVGKERSAMAAMVISGGAALVVAVPGAPLWVILAVAAVWGVSVVADSAQFSAIVSERADQRYVGTVLTVQLAFGFLLTVATMWLVPFVRDEWGWWAAFAILAPGPLFGALALRRIDVRS